MRSCLRLSVASGILNYKAITKRKKYGSWFWSNRIYSCFTYNFLQHSTNHPDIQVEGIKGHIPVDHIFAVRGNPPLVHPRNRHRWFAGYSGKWGFPGIVRSYDWLGHKISITIWCLLFVCYELTAMSCSHSLPPASYWSACQLGINLVMSWMLFSILSKIGWNNIVKMTEYNIRW